MDYGNSPRTIAQIAKAGFCIGAVAAIVAFFCIVFNKLPLHSISWLAAPILIVPGVLILAVLPTVFFRIRIIDDRVQHIFLGRYILSNYSIRDFRYLRRFERGCAAVLHFRNDRRIHFFGAHWGIISKLSKDLLKKRAELKVAEQDAAANP